MKISELIKLDEDSKGQQVMAFSDFMYRISEKVSPERLKQFKQLGAALLKHGFKYDDTMFVRLPDEGGVDEVVFPTANSVNNLRQGLIYLHHYRFVRGKKYEFDKHMYIDELEGVTAPELVQMMRRSAPEAKR